MSCSPLSAIKKQNLPPYNCRAQNPLSVGLGMVWERTQEAIQQMLDDAPKAKWYDSDGFDAYARLGYHFGRYEVSEGKADTFSVEAENADLRHYLAGPARKSRCFSRDPYALYWVIRWFAFCYNSRQLYKERYPNYSANLMDLISPLH